MSYQAPALKAYASGTIAFFGARHRYYLKRKASVLKLQVRKDLMSEFLKTQRGRQLLQIVDIVSVGYGWYEIRTQDFSHLDFLEAAGGKRDGLPLFIRMFNLWIQPPVTVNMHASNDSDSKSEPKLKAVIKGNTISMPKKVASQESLQALVAKFN